jgi:hypothetical protein
MSQARFQKQQREKARREKAAAKWARREERRSTRDEAQPSSHPTDQAHVLAELAELHERFDAGTIAFDDFVFAKDELMRRLHVD